MAQIFSMKFTAVNASLQTSDMNICGSWSSGARFSTIMHSDKGHPRTLGFLLLFFPFLDQFRVLFVYLYRGNKKGSEKHMAEIEDRPEESYSLVYGFCGDHDSMAEDEDSRTMPTFLVQNLTLSSCM